MQRLTRFRSCLPSNPGTRFQSLSSRKRQCTLAAPPPTRPTTRPSTVLPFYKRHPVLSFTLSTFALTTSTVFAVANYDEHTTFQQTESRLPLAYDAAAISSFWSHHSCVALCRVFTITSNVVPFLIRAGVAVAWQDEWQESQQHEWGVELRELMSLLGPTFIKFGQMLSIRPDILPTPILVELQKLCDACQPFSTEAAIDLIEQELGTSVSTMYNGLDRTSVPIAAASLGQVYKCQLKTDNTWVAVKVQRPDMVRAVSLDLYILRHYTSCVESLKSFLMTIGYLGQRKQFDVHLLDTFANASYYELGK